ncbi:MAG: hypothetical protein KatS3mg110_3758 [Pirellulaceae bacterium]|nr:MAG: hypothetical protein KatS3mg110_3758 [Pirellulaceae bacterium]
MPRVCLVNVVLLVVCAVLALGTVYDKSFCGLILAWGPNRAAECTSDGFCWVVNGLCTNSSNETVQYGAYMDVELDYHTCRPAPQTVYKCKVLSTVSPCLIRYFFMESACSGTIVCAYARVVNDCETTF